MVDEVKDSLAEATPQVEPTEALPQVPAVEAAAPEAAVVPEVSKPKRGRPAGTTKVKADSVKALEVVSKAAKLPKPAKTTKSVTPAKTLTKAGPAKKLPVATSPVLPAVKSAIKRPSTAISRPKIASVKANPSVKPFVGTASAPTTRKELFAMATTPTEYTEKMQAAFKDAQEKAKAAFGDVGSFAKGNVEAMVESTKILAAGLQDMTKGYVETSKSSVEAMTADVKDLAAVKSPTEFFEKQSALMRKNFDAAVAASSKNSEAMLKLVSEAFQPISTRVSLAVEKIKHAA
ncbi:phasin family protein [Novosphingobium hassiacum]|uniref:Phasin family protein n=1 Tax=Novosphingobium hassiacum TaxID=173676 RepID=A0A7W5ZZA2_9SPHN|nr:phasin family protein [Novosphingobium hassiacum]MBB3862256.1 phasin family protein [Novosphingobium hassiacum]